MKKLILSCIIMSIFLNSCLSIVGVFNRNEHEKTEINRELLKEYNKVNLDNSNNNLKITFLNIYQYDEKKTITPKNSYGDGNPVIYILGLISTVIISAIIPNLVINDPNKNFDRVLLGEFIYILDLVISASLVLMSKKSEKYQYSEEKIVKNAPYNIKIGDKKFEGVIPDDGIIRLNKSELVFNDFESTTANIVITKSDKEVYSEKFSITK